MAVYRAVFGHVGDILPGTRFESRQDVKDAKLHKEQRAGISWGRDGDGERAVLCLCSNCHVRLDRGAIYLTDELEVVERFADGAASPRVRLLTVDEHRIQQRFIRAHRRFWGIEGGSS
ncbi:hypothetical protein [Streptomyces sp. NPDC005408]|uniref:hypothetical protein n=1 Tax=Streptomyces sp. NPDC005408 TaxID=3155341 RepID=UPI0033B80C66